MTDWEINFDFQMTGEDEVSNFGDFQTFHSIVWLGVGGWGRFGVVVCAKEDAGSCVWSS